jgi:hypothetical protein
MTAIPQGLQRHWVAIGPLFDPQRARIRPSMNISGSSSFFTAPCMRSLQRVVWASSSWLRCACACERVGIVSRICCYSYLPPIPAAAIGTGLVRTWCWKWSVLDAG